MNIERVSGEPIPGGLPDQSFREVDIEKEKAEANLKKTLDDRREKLVEHINRLKEISEHQSLRSRLEDEE